MRSTARPSLKKCSEEECMAIAVYLVRILEGSENFERHEETQVLFNLLVKKLGLEKHYKTVLKAYIEKLVKQRKLTPYAVRGGVRPNPFDCTDSLPRQFREDQRIYENCGQFSTSTYEDVDLVRCIFSGDDKNYYRIAAHTFFGKPAADGKPFNISREARPDARFLKAVNSCDKVKFLKDSLKLSDEETQLITCSYRTLYYRELYDVVNDITERAEEIDRASMYALEMGFERKDVMKLLRPEEKLYSFGLYDEDGRFASDAIAAIDNQDLNLYFADIIRKGKKDEKSFELDSFSVKKEKTELLERLLQNNPSGNFLFYGAPGSGKTEYAKAVVAASGLKPLIYKNELEVKENDSSETALYRLNCLLNVKQSDCVIIVDEAESVLKTMSTGFFGMKTTLPRKGTVNRMLENSENKVIWITNYTDELDDSTLRRFTYSMKFGEMPKEMLRSIAESKLQSVKMSPELKAQVVALFDRYHVTGSSVDNMVKTLKGMNCTKENAGKVLNDVKEVLEANSTLVFGKKKMRDMVNTSYDLSVLNTSVPVDDIVSMVEAAAEYEENNRDSQSGIRMLFYGASGTGKTELVRYLAEKLNKKIVLKRASDILGKYVGENEENIRKAFAEAEADDAILLFDEADSFFASREDANTSWERTMVNEFLTQMEEFSGILICTTNLRKIMDPAMERRFHIMTEFKPLNKDGVVTLLGKFFEGYSFSTEEIEKISAFESVTPGDFGALSGRMKFVPKARLSSQYIIDGLCSLQAEKRTVKSIGFGA